MIKKTRWSPDTCKCVLEYEWDDSVALEQREHTPAEVIFSCEYHQSVKTDAREKAAEIMAAVSSENKGKNRALAAILEEAQELTETVERDGEQIKQFKPGEEPAWSFDENRRLVIEIKGRTKLNAQRIAAIKSAVTAKGIDGEVK